MIRAGDRGLRTEEVVAFHFRAIVNVHLEFSRAIQE
jgi:hypothetical protein